MIRRVVAPPGTRLTCNQEGACNEGAASELLDVCRWSQAARVVQWCLRGAGGRRETVWDEMLRAVFGESVWTLSRCLE